MDISKFKFELYDVLAVLVPGFALVCNVWILLRGWPTFLAGFLNVTVVGFTAILLIAFPFGHLIQELGDVAFKTFLGERYFKAGRDSFWKQEDASKIRKAITLELGFDPSVDTAFDFCLSRTKDLLVRRDSFLATSDLSRSLVVLGILAVPTLMRVLLELPAASINHRIAYGVASFFAWLLFLYLSQRRMSRFRGFSERPVFRAYLASMNSKKAGDKTNNSIEQEN